MVASANDAVYVEMGLDSYQRLGEQGWLKIGYREDKHLIIQLIDDSAFPDIEEENEPRGVQ